MLLARPSLNTWVCRRLSRKSSGFNQDIIELHPVLIKHSNPHQSSEDGVTLEESSGVLIVKGQELSSSLSDLGKGVLDPPNLSFVSETEFTNELQFMVKSLLLKGTPWGCVPC